jgi:hypothetical protein
LTGAVIGEGVTAGEEDAHSRTEASCPPRRRRAHDLENANGDCLRPDQRALYFAESGVEARDRYRACERRHDRVPGDGESP